MEVDLERQFVPRNAPVHKAQILIDDLIEEEAAQRGADHALNRTAFRVDAFNTTPPFPFEEGTPQLQFARSVQRDFAEQDWTSLADKLSFPLFVLLPGENHMLQSREEFLEMVNGNNPLTEEFCDMVANADLASYGVCELGSTFAAHRLAFVCVSDMLESADDLRVSAISVPGPLYSYTGNGYVQVTPEP